MFSSFGARTMKPYFRISIFFLFASASAWADAQCGSYSGADGALNITAAGVTVLNPAALGLNASGDNIFQFTTINIAQGSTLKLTSEMMRSKPVVFCASGTVTIAGVLDLSGAQGTNVNNSNPWLSHAPAQPGPGGFTGGLGEVSFVGVHAGPTVGFGSGAPTCSNIAVQQCWGAGAAHATTGTLNNGYANGAATGTTYGNAASNPLTGGSGGNGSSTNNTGGIGGGNGGSGGGAIRIASATSISVNGSILAKGGVGGAPDANTATGNLALTTGGAGSGGDIHLLAPAISGTGTLDTSGGASVHDSGGHTSGAGGAGWILLNTNTNAFTGTLNGLFFSGMFIVPTPVAPPSVTITSVNGVSAPANPAGDPTVPDVTIAANAAVAVTIAASQVPLGTVVTLTLVPTTGAAVSAQCSPLAGTTVSSTTASCSVTFPTGVSLAAATATW
jgi:hypothetical protein